MRSIFSLFFGRLANVPSDGPPVSGLRIERLVPWMFFAEAVRRTSASLVADANILRKVYFPRSVPTARVLALLVDLLIALVVLLVLMAAYGIPAASAMRSGPARGPRVHRALGVGMFLAALNVRYRDVAVAVPLGFQSGIPLAGRLPGRLVRAALAVRVRTEPDGYASSRACAGRCLGAARRTADTVSLRSPSRSFSLRPGVLPSHRTLLRRHHLTWRSKSRSERRGLGKQYRLGQLHELGTGCERSCCRGASARGRARRRETFWALRDVSFEVEARRGRRHHRPQRRRQEHAAQDPRRGSPSRPTAESSICAAGSARCWRSAPASIPS